MWRAGGAAVPGSWNRYAYVEGDPVNYNDPEGLFALLVFGPTLSWRPERPPGVDPNFFMFSSNGPLPGATEREDPTREDAGIGAHPGGGGGGGGLAETTNVEAKRETANVFDCAADFGNKYSLAAGVAAILPIERGNPVVSILFGNDASTISDILTGRNR